MVSQRTFYAHKKEYYDHDSGTWKKKVRRQNDFNREMATPEVRIDNEVSINNITQSSALRAYINRISKLCS